jgi:putative nucleotidyltransferase with HDIG domain
MSVLKGLFGTNKKKKVKPAPPKLSADIARSIMKAIGSRGIPTMPGAAQKAFKLSVDPNAEARDFVEVIESDEALSARVIKIANSVYFDRGKPSKTIEESVTVIGINELKNLLNATTLSDIFPSRHRARQELWAHDIATALTARALARRLLPSKEDNAFLGGLMHDIGKLLLLQRTGTDYNKILDIVQRRGVPFCTAEEEIFVFNHTEVGQLIAEKWNFTDELVDIIRSHHTLPGDTEGSTADPDLTTIIKSANILSHALGLGMNRGYAKLQNACKEQLDEIWEILGIEASERRDFTAGLQKTFDLEYDLYKGNS